MSWSTTAPAMAGKALRVLRTTSPSNGSVVNADHRITCARGHFAVRDTNTGTISDEKGDDSRASASINVLADPTAD